MKHASWSLGLLLGLLAASGCTEKVQLTLTGQGEGEGEGTGEGEGEGEGLPDAGGPTDGAVDGGEGEGEGEGELCPAETPTYTYVGFAKAVIDPKCSNCHSAQQRAGGYSTASYAELTANGKDAVPDVVPCDATSEFLRFCCGEMAVGIHAGIAQADREKLIDWVVKDGAPEDLAAEGEGEGEGEVCPAETPTYTYVSYAKAIIDAKCTAGCHSVAAHMGSYVTDTYAAVAANGNDAVPDLVPCDETSMFLRYCCGDKAVGMHLNKVPAPDQLKLIDWVVKDGAPEQGGGGGGETCPRDPPVYTYTSYAKAIIDTKCTAGCHSSAAHMGNYMTDTYENVAAVGNDAVPDLVACDETSMFLRYCCGDKATGMHLNKVPAPDQAKLIEWVTQDGAAQ